MTPAMNRHAPPQALLDVLHRGLRVNPEDRWRDLMQLLQEVDQAVPDGAVDLARQEHRAPVGLWMLLMLPFFAQLCSGV